MARIRTIKPDAFTSDSLSSVPRGTRWTFAGLWTYADDAGRGRDDARLIKAALYPIDDDTTLGDVADDLKMLHQIGAICRYQVAGRSYLHMPNWGHQKINRPTPPKSPACPLHEGSGDGEVVPNDPYVSTHGVLTESSLSPQGGKGKEGKGKGKDSCPPADADRRDADTDLEAEFADWYDRYPRKEARGRALKAYRSARRKTDAPTLLSAVDAQRDYLTRKGHEYVPHPTTWLNGERWLDQPADSHPAATEPAAAPVTLRQCDTGTTHGRHRWEDTHNRYFCQGET